MEKQADIQTNYSEPHWLDIAEMIAVAGSIGGSVAAIFLEEIVLASIPLSACVALNLMNRKRLLSAIATENNKAIATLTQNSQNHYGNICDRVGDLEQSIGDNQNKSETSYQHLSGQIAQIDANSKTQIEELKLQYNQLSSKTTKLVQSTTSNSAELYYQNATSYQQMGEKQKAIAEYTRAIEIDSKYAEAYVNRGFLLLDAGKKQSAIEDLRNATKLYFDRGDLDSYQLIKQKTQNIYQLESSSTSKEDFASISANSLFSQI